MPVPLERIGPFAAVAVFVIMFALGLKIGRGQIAVVSQRPAVLAAMLLAVVVVIPALAVAGLTAFDVRGPVAVGIVLMAISPGAPIALRRAMSAGGSSEFAVASHLAIVMLSVLTVPGTMVLLDWMLPANFSITPLHVVGQVFFAQLLPLSLGASLRATAPAVVARIEVPMGHIGTALLLALVIGVLANLPPIVSTVGWTPMVAGSGLTLFALAIGAACAWRDPDARPAAAIAAAMRNPGLALVIATANHATPDVIASVVGYALGLAATILPVLVWRKRRRR